MMKIRTKNSGICNLIRDENLAGIILSPTRQTADNFSATSELNIPMVVIDRRVSDAEVDNIVIDNVQAAHTITTHLIEHGYRRIGAIFGIGSTTGRERREGFVQALKAYDLQPSTDLVKYANPREEDGFNTTMKVDYSCPNRPMPSLPATVCWPPAHCVRFGKARLRFPRKSPLPVLTKPPGPNLSYRP